MYKLINIHKSFNDLKVLDGINLNIKENEIISLIGPSGCGKTTLMNIIAGVNNEYDGDLIGFDKKNISYLFQDLRLIPWKNVYENISFVLRGKVNKEKIHSIIMDYLEKLELTGYEKYKINELSGGMQQRVSLARAFAYPSDLLLMDEPFKSLDFEIRHHIINQFKSLWLSHKKTVIFVTHDIQSAILLSDRIFLLSKKPTKIIKEYNNIIPFHERNLTNKNFSMIEKQVYFDFMKKDSY